MKRIIENIVSYRNESSFYFTTKTGVFIKVLSYNRIRVKANVFTSHYDDVDDIVIFVVAVVDVVVVVVVGSFPVQIYVACAGRGLMFAIWLSEIFNATKDIVEEILTRDLSDQ
ncbi:hypothetical protein GQX74_007433 [Glossina fuscipes]|nr:hypothetical protein GQX74_007433 [Glossina fuscipes]